MAKWGVLPRPRGECFFLWKWGRAEGLGEGRRGSSTPPMELVPRAPENRWRGLELLALFNPDSG